MIYEFNPEIKAFNLSSRAKIHAYKIQMTKIRNKHEKIMRTNVRRVFRAQDRAIGEIEDYGDWNQIVQAIHKTDQAMKAALGYTYVKIADDIYPMVDTTKRVKIAIERKELPYDAQLRTWIENNLGEKITNIDQTTLRQIRRIYDETILQGDFRDELLQITFRNKVHELYADHITPFRANCISRTETAQASNRASLETTRSIGGAQEKQWIAVGDMDTRDSHQHMNGVKVPFDVPFHVDGLNGPCEMDCPLDSTRGAPVEEIANCRCFIGYEY